MDGWMALNFAMSILLKFSKPITSLWEHLLSTTLFKWSSNKHFVRFSFGLWLGHCKAFFFLCWMEAWVTVMMKTLLFETEMNNPLTKTVETVFRYFAYILSISLNNSKFVQYFNSFLNTPTKSHNPKYTSMSNTGNSQPSDLKKILSVLTTQIKPFFQQLPLLWAYVVTLIKSLFSQSYLPHYKGSEYYAFYGYNFCTKECANISAIRSLLQTWRILEVLSLFLAPFSWLIPLYNKLFLYLITSLDTMVLVAKKGIKITAEPFRLIRFMINE